MGQTPSSNSSNSRSDGAACRLRFRALRPGETDHEAIWLPVLAGAFSLAAAWIGLGLPRPGCFFRGLTGLPCPGCGATRGLAALLEGDVAGAFASNPLLASGFLASALFALYALAVLLFRLPRARIEGLPGKWLRPMAWGLLAANWGYLLTR